MLQRLRRRATWLVGRAHLRAHSLLYDAFTEAGSRPYHYRVLAALDERGPMSQAQVGRLAGLDRSDVTAALDVLCDTGIAVREPDPADRRRNLVSLTAEGHAELRRLDAVVDDAQTSFLSPLTVEERRTLIALLARLTEDVPDQP